MSEALRLAYERIISGDLVAAEELLLSSIRDETDGADWHSVRGALAMAKLEFGAALADFDFVVWKRPLAFPGWYNRGLCLYELGRFDEAIESYRRALVIEPGRGVAWMKLGGAYLASHRFVEALACHERARGLDPGSAEAMTALATTLGVFGDDAASEGLFRSAWEVSGNAISETGLGFSLLRQGKWEEGWARFQARWKLRGFGQPYDIRHVPLWAGRAEELAGRRVLVRSEQGFGDSIQFARYVPLVAGRAAKVWLVVERSLASLLQGLGAEVLVRGAELPEFDVQTSLMTLPLVFGTTPGNVPPPVLPAVEACDPGAEVGVCWHGGSRPHDPLAHADDQRRSIAWEVFGPVCGVVPCVSLQEEDLRAAGVVDWKGTAERIAGLKLVITVDTAVAHLAATLGVETWLLARKAGCWRWLNEGETTAWYPSMRIYRQPVLDRWEPVVERVVEDLRAWARK